MQTPDVNFLSDSILKGDRRSLSKGITLVESTRQDHRTHADELLHRIMSSTGNSVRIGITGVPGAGKSTLIEELGLYAISQGKKVAVLAIDPSSSLNGGSILGDKTRMEKLATHPQAFIRPSPTSGHLGGVANATYESMLLCEAAGYDLILIETVGVGQSEILVSEITDVFLFLKLTGAGDELQGIKRGIMEMVDLIFINKIHEENLPLGKATRQQLLKALHFLPEKYPGWKPPILLGSALENKGIAELYQQIMAFVKFKKENYFFDQTRSEQNRKRFSHWVSSYMLDRVLHQEPFNKLYQEKLEATTLQAANPSSEARALVDEFFKSINSKQTS